MLYMNIIKTNLDSMLRVLLVASFWVLLSLEMSLRLASLNYASLGQSGDQSLLPRSALKKALYDSETAQVN